MNSPSSSPAFYLHTGCFATASRLQNIVLLGAGYYFYACWNPKFLALLILSTVVDFGCGLWVDRIESPIEAPCAVALSIAVNLGMLGYFKYYNFFAENLQAALGRAGSADSARAP